MNRKTHALVSAIFLAACDLEPTEQETYLDEHCAGDPEVRTAVEALLASELAELGLL